MEFIFSGEQEVSASLLRIMGYAAEACLRQENMDQERCQVSVSFVDEETIQELNRTYRDVDSITDVLSFPQFDDLAELPEEGIFSLGDVVICQQRAREQAEEFGHSYERELIYLFTHSMLHLLGYDHMEEEDQREMRAQEEAVMTYLGLVR